MRYGEVYKQTLEGKEDQLGDIVITRIRVKGIESVLLLVQSTRSVNSIMWFRDKQLIDNCVCHTSGLPATADA